MIVVAVMVVGALGSLARFTVDSEIKARWPGTFPLGTVVINISGSLLLGVLTAAVVYHHQPQAVLTVFGVGFCGGYTTFSTASFETVRLLQDRRHLLALANLVLPLVMSVGACALGWWMVSLF